MGCNCSSNVDMILAATYTTSYTMILLIMEIINDQNIQMKILNSIKSGLNGNDENILTQSKYRWSFPYLNMVIKETYRKYPASILSLPHITTNDVTIDGHTIAAGTKIIQNVYASHRSEEFFKNPDKFIPERFEENTDNKNNSSINLVNFGLGLRDCIGKTLAENEIFTLMASLINRYHFINPTHDNFKVETGSKILIKMRN